jgi:hypothetical protein
MSASPTPQGNTIDYDDITVGEKPIEWDLEHVIIIMVLFLLLCICFICIPCKLPRFGTYEKRESKIKKRKV